MRKHSEYMELALHEALLAEATGDIPVGCVIVSPDGTVLSRAHNEREKNKNPLHHAEILAIDRAAQAVKDWRLSDCTLYVTLEPCPMCMGAILTARIKRVVFGASDYKAGCCGSFQNLNEVGFPHHCELLGGISELACSQLLKEFFEKRR